MPLVFTVKMNQQAQNFPALHDIELELTRLMQIKREQLTPLLQQPTLLTHYADVVIQQQNQLLLTKSILTSPQLSQLIREMIQHLNQSSRYLKPKKFNVLQKWLGIDLEQQASSVGYVNQLNSLVQQAARLSERVAVEVYQSQKNLQALHDLRIEMAHHVVAAEQFLQEARQFSHVQHLQMIEDRLNKKINMLMTSQSATDLAMLQIQLSQNVAMTILDRFNEAKNVLIPSWQQHVLQLRQADSPVELQKLNDARDRLIDTLDGAVRSNQKT